jgi:RimJ/RimL family protein N-acetyltransferase
MARPLSEVELRAVRSSDIRIFFDQQLDETANRMAGFAMDDPRDERAHSSHWTKVLADASNRTQTILWRGQVVGHIARFDLLGKPSVAYWIGKEFWGRGIATEAMRQFLRALPERPLFARVASDNRGSIRVLEKSGFQRVGSETSYANARKAEIEEFIYRLAGP